MENELTVAEINTLIEAVDAWTSASRHGSLLAGLFMGSLIAKAGGGSEESLGEAKSAVDKFTEGEKEKEQAREEQAIILKAKLIALRDKAEAREFASSVTA